MDAPTKLRDLAVSETGFVFDPSTGATFSVNASGLVMLAGLKDGQEREAITERLRDAFETGEADLQRDLDEFVGLLRQHGILPEDFRL